MMNYLSLLCSAFLLVLQSGTAWAGSDINPGKWEITTRTEMAGMPSQSATHVQCLTHDDIVPMSGDANQACRVEDVRVNGNTITWSLTCGEGQGGGMTGTGWVVYSGDRMDGEMNMTISSYGTQVKNTLSGKRLGDCDDASSGTPVQFSGASPDASGTGTGIGAAVAEDAKELGQTARDEAKQSTKEEVREGVRGFLKGIFK